MASPPQNSSAPPASSGSTILRVILFGVLAYMVFALAYDFLYVFPTHEAKYTALLEKVEAETKRSAENVDQEGSTGPKQVAELIGFASGGLQDGGHYQYERYTFRRGLPWMTRFIEVYYKGPKDAPFIYSVAHAEEEIAEARPQPPVVPNDLPEGTPDGEEDKKEMEENDKKKGIAPIEEEPKPAEPATEEPKSDEPKDDTPTTDVPKAEDKTADDAPADPPADAEGKQDK